MNCMMKFGKLFCIFAVVVSVVGCKPIEPNGEMVGYHFIFDGGVDVRDETRVYWSEDEGRGNLVFNWDYTPVGEAGDEVVMVFWGSGCLASIDGDYSTFVNVKRHSNGDGCWAMFETVEAYEKELIGDVYEGYDVIAVTPMIDENGAKVTCTAREFVAEMFMPNSFVQDVGGNPDFLRNYMYMYAQSDISHGRAMLNFRHIPATFRFIITNKRPNDAFINSIKMIVEDGEGGIYPVAGQVATVVMNGNNIGKGINPIYSGEYEGISTMIDCSVACGGKYIAYALAFPLEDNMAFEDRNIMFVVDVADLDNEHLAFNVNGSMIADVNKNYGKELYNWVGGMCYSIHLRVDDALILEGISVNDWTDGGIIDGGEVEEEIVE